MLDLKFLLGQDFQLFLEPVDQIQKSRASEDYSARIVRKAVGDSLYCKDLVVFLEANIRARFNLCNLDNISKLAYNEEIALLDDLHTLQPHIEKPTLLQLSHPTTLERKALTDFDIDQFDIV